MLKQEGKLGVVHISDIHWGAIPPRDLYDQLKKVFIKWIKEHSDKIDMIMIQGDYYHTKLPLTDATTILSTKFLNSLCLLCKKLKIEIRIIKGTKTHDYNQLDNFKCFEKQFKFFKVIDKISEETYEGVKFLYVPEEYMNDQDSFYEEYKKQSWNYIIGHGSWDKFAFQNQITESERPIKGSPVFIYNEWKNAIGNGLIMFGHIHAYNNYKQLYYTGSFTRWCFGEELDKGFMFSEFDIEKEKATSVEFIKNKYAQEFKTVSIKDETNSDLEELVDKINELSSKGVNYRVKLDKDISLDKLDIIRETFSTDDTIKIELQSMADKIEEEAKEEHDFLSDNSNENIKAFIKEKNDFDISIEDIERIVSEEEE
jgi:DNA repair exonuclease SbcCD nuclease subunit